MIAIYTGHEGNVFRRRIADYDGGRIAAAGAKSLGKGDAEPLGRDVIRTLANRLLRATGAIT